MKPKKSSLEGAPPEVVSEIAAFLERSEVGELRTLSREMNSKLAFAWASYLRRTTVTFNAGEFYHLANLLESETNAKALRALIITRAAPPELEHVDTQQWCCGAGQAQYYLTLAFQKMKNLEQLVIEGYSFDMDHISCDPASCDFISAVHRSLPAIFEAVKHSGISVPHLTFAQRRMNAYARRRPRLRAEQGLGPCQSMIAPLATEVLANTKVLVINVTWTDLDRLHDLHPSPVLEMVRAAPMLECLNISNATPLMSGLGNLLDLMPTTGYSSLRKLSLCREGISMQNLKGFLENNKQIKKLFITKVHLDGGNWLPILKLLRDKFSLSHIVFYANSCQDGWVFSNWNGKFGCLVATELPFDGPGSEEWVFIDRRDDGGESFSSAVKMHGMKQALSIFIEGYYTAERRLGNMPYF
ncbi:hypothetical protein DIS24_g9849 [Lasiodiplodia hormozganensis]|uniref:F-box domain-containing protein n=1 Tax=Lasiodiplodia hormozganensis TaxID=869390 RepID=A0AA39XQS2_9PEZI|nr:hypothetical protein DIS24_g9849 [Lasiodiplodia hormozganensis]